MNIIGPAGRIAASLKQRIQPGYVGPLKLLLHGSPGVGKTELANAIAESLGSKWDRESVNGRNVTIELVREWQMTMHCTSMFGEWKVKILNEADLMSRPAQDLMLSVLDELPANRAIICTSNAAVGDLSERFHTRFQKHKVDAPSQEEVANLLVCQHGLPPDQAAFISVASGGNVRAALNDADVWLGEHRPSKGSRAVQLESLELLGALGL